ncbi:MAG: calcium/sodium antiporter [Sedimentisphaerales bacterium]|nr:calcium/sodium antiporter [Sedimentisphaerales bacterium]
MLSYVLMIVGFGVVIAGAELLIRGSSALARRLRVSDLAIGLTVVAFGTSLPELFVNLTASVKGDAGIALGNIMGSNTANILLILGICGVIKALTVTKGTVWKEIPLSLLAAVLVWVLGNDVLIDGGESGVLARSDGIVLICFFIVFLYYTVGIAQEIHGMGEMLHGGGRGPAAIAVMICAGLFCLVVGSRWIVNGAVQLAAALGVGQTVIGLTIVAVGTSLPELTTSAVATWRGNFEIAVGNIVGSNIFNIFFILGISAIIRPLPLPAEQSIDIMVTVAASLLLLLFMLTGKRRMLDRWEGGVFIVAYVVYVLFLVFRAGRSTAL